MSLILKKYKPEMDKEQDLMPPEGEEMGGDIELNPSNAFGELLLDLIEAQYAGDIGAGIQALVEATGRTEKEVAGFISGKNIVDDEADLEAIISAFPDASEEEIEQIIEVASGVEEEDRAILEAQYGGEEGQPLEEEMSPEQRGAKYAAAYNQANFNRNVAEELRTLRAEKNALEANFAKDKFDSELSAYLSDFDARLTSDVENGRLTPAMKSALIGNFTNPRERVAQFSAIAKSNGVRDLREQLHASEFAYSLLSNVANVTQFVDFSVSAEEEATANFSASLASAAEGDLAAMGYDANSYGL